MITKNKKHRTLAGEVKARLAKPPRFKLWTRGNRGRYFDTFEAANAAAEKVRAATGVFLLITKERGSK